MDYSKLRGRIRAYFSTQAAFARALGISECSLSQKLNGHTDWTAEEIRSTCGLLEIPPDEIHIYFFYPKS